MNPTVLCIGGANLDRKLKLSEPFKMGTSNPVTSQISCGGVARNVAENLTRLDYCAVLLSTFSDDLDGSWLLGQIESMGIDCSPSLKQPGMNSGSYTALQNPDGEMLLAMADMQLADSITVDQMEKIWKSMSLPDAVFLDTNFPKAVLKWVIEQCRKNRLVLHVDPVSVAKSRKLPESLEGIDTLQPNLDELESLTGTSLLKHEQQIDACKSLLERGVKKVVLSLGSGGLLWVSEESQFSIPAISVKVTDVTGAGDALCAGVLWGQIKGYSNQISSEAGMMMATKTMECDSSVWPGLRPSYLKPLLDKKQEHNNAC